MSSRSRNHTRGTMRAWKGMAVEAGYSFPPRARWAVRAIAKQERWTFTDGFLFTMYPPSYVAYLTRLSRFGGT